MTRYLSMLKIDIRQFVSTQQYDSLLDLQEAARLRELIDLQLKEKRPAPTESQPTPKRFKAVDSWS